MISSPYGPRAGAISQITGALAYLDVLIQTDKDREAVNHLRQATGLLLDQLGNGLPPREEPPGPVGPEWVQEELARAEREAAELQQRGGPGK